MVIYMKLCKKLSSAIKKLTVFDISLIKLSVFAFALMVANLWQPILALDWYWYALIAVIAAIKPTMKMF
jgi:hypothetical protein